MKKAIVLGGRLYSDYARSVLGYEDCTTTLLSYYTEGGYIIIPDDIELVVFAGGADIDPIRYNSKKNDRTYCNPEQDKFEFNLYKKAVDMGIPCFGICRGSQLLCVANGGEMIQDVQNHAGVYHWVNTNTKKRVYVSSTHHQMSVPNKENSILLAWSERRLSDNWYKNGEDLRHSATFDPDFKETEAVWYPRTNSLGVQWHPEIMDFSSDGATIIRDEFFKLLRTK